MDNFDWRKTININILILRVTGLWPKGYEVYKLDLYLFYAVLITLILFGIHDLTQILNIFFVYDDLEALTATIFIAATNTFAIVKRYFYVKNLQVIKNLFLTLNTSQFRPKNQRHMNLIESSAKNWKRAYIGFNIVVTSWLWLFAPFGNDMVKNKQLPFEAWYPFEVDTSPNYEIVYSYQFICIWYIALTNLNVDTLIFAFMMFIGSQCDMLMDDLKNISSKNFAKEFVVCIKHHKKILSFAEDTNNIFNFIIFGQIFTSTAALALSMFQLSLVDFSSGADMLTPLIYVIGMCTEIFLYCWFGNEVQDKSSEIPYAVYESGWIGQSTLVMKDLLIFCEKCRRPIRITAMNLFTFSLDTFIAILRSAWSYFAVLSTVNEK